MPITFSLTIHDVRVAISGLTKDKWRYLGTSYVGALIEGFPEFEMFPHDPWLEEKKGFTQGDPKSLSLVGGDIKPIILGCSDHDWDKLPSEQLALEAHGTKDIQYAKHLVIGFRSSVSGENRHFYSFSGPEDLEFISDPLLRQLKTRGTKKSVLWSDIVDPLIKL